MSKDWIIACLFLQLDLAWRQTYEHAESYSKFMVTDFYRTLDPAGNEITFF